jgi:hypothetical protein
MIQRVRLKYFKGSHPGKNIFINEHCSFYEKYSIAVAFEVLIAVVMKSSIFWDIT